MRLLILLYCSLIKFSKIVYNFDQIKLLISSGILSLVSLLNSSIYFNGRLYFNEGIWDSSFKIYLDLSPVLFIKVLFGGSQFMYLGFHCLSFVSSFGNFLLFVLFSPSSSRIWGLKFPFSLPLKSNFFHFPPFSSTKFFLFGSVNLYEIMGITLDNEFFNLFIRLLVLWSNVLIKWVFSYLLTFISSVWLLLHWDCLHGLFLILLAVFSLSCTVLSIFVLLLGFDNGPLLCSSYLKTWCSLLFEIIQSQPSYLIMLHPFVSFLLFFVYAFKPFKAFLFCLCRRLFISTYHYGTSKIL